MAEHLTPVLYSVPEAAAILRVSVRWLYERTRKGEVPFRRIGKYVRFTNDDLKEIIRVAFIPTTATISDSMNGSYGKQTTF
jgi:excisionase family DNA binding protein